MAAPNLTPELVAKLVAFVRAGAQATSAANVLGIDADTFNEWMLKDPDVDSIYRDLRKQIDHALAEVQLATEIELRKRQPRSWLRTAKHAKLKSLPLVPRPVPPRLKLRAVLTGQQRKFVLAYIESGNGKQSALMAGYSKTNPDRAVAQLLRAPHIQKAIRDMGEEIIREGKITARRVLQELAALAFVDPGDFFDEKGDLLPISKMPEHARRALTAIEVEELFEAGRDGRAPGVLRKIKFAAKTPALIALGKHLKMFGETLELTGKDGAPLTIVHLLERLGPIPAGASRAAIEAQAIEVESSPVTEPAPAAIESAEIDLSSLPPWKE